MAYPINFPTMILEIAGRPYLIKPSFWMPVSREPGLMNTFKYTERVNSINTTCKIKSR